MREQIVKGSFSYFNSINRLSLFPQQQQRLKQVVQTTPNCALPQLFWDSSTSYKDTNPY